MANKKSKLGMISVVAAGTGTAIYLAQKAKNKSENGDASQSISPLFSKKKTDDISLRTIIAIRSVENMNEIARESTILMETIEAFAHPEKPEGVDDKHA